VMDKPSKWEDYLHLVEFSYNNGYQDSLKTSNLKICMVENAIIQ
jgi:hypothetical protein